MKRKFGVNLLQCADVVIDAESDKLHVQEEAILAQILAIQLPAVQLFYRDKLLRSNIDKCSYLAPVLVVSRKVQVALLPKAKLVLVLEMVISSRDAAYRITWSFVQSQHLILAPGKNFRNFPMANTI